MSTGVEVGEAHVSSGSSGFGQILDVIKTPSFIVYSLELLFGIIVAACIADKVQYGAVCFYNLNSGACNYGIAVGVMAIIFSVMCIVACFVTPHMASLRRPIAFVEFSVAILMDILFFVAFCFLVDQWRQTSKGGLPSSIVSNAQAAIAFCFFSICTWGVSTWLAYLKIVKSKESYDDIAAPETAATYSGYQNDPFPPK